MWAKVTSDTTGWTMSVGNNADTYYRLESLPYLEVRGPAPTGSLYYIGCEATSSTVYLAPGYSTQAAAEAALDEFVKSANAGGLTGP
jgi:hypothetical protein